MRQEEKLRRVIKNYLKHPKSPSQNELARRIGISAAALSQFLNRKHCRLTREHEIAILNIVAPWQRDPTCVAGRLKTMLLKQHYSNREISKILQEMLQTIHRILSG